MEITIPARFCGPKNSGNGGYSCGIVANLLDGAAEVTLRAPPPLDTPLQAQVENGHARLLHNGTLIAEAAATKIEVQPPPAPTWEQALTAQKRFPGLEHHDFPHCFTCGTARKPGDGLRVQTGPVEGSDVFASTWIPDASLADRDGFVRPEFFWAATDCPGAWATLSRQQGPSLLGRFAARFTRKVKAGDRCIVIGWAIGHEGRKHHAGTALFTATGERIGAGRQTWIEIRPK
jgi:hypothetical protein